MSLLGTFTRVSKRTPCPVCGKPDWCLISGDEPSEPSQVLCARVESRTRWRDAGWLHQLKHDPRPRSRTRARRVLAAPPEDMSKLASSFEGAVEGDRLVELSQELGVSAKSLRRLGIGWSGSAWAFPMYKEGLVGIRLRTGAGRKFAVKGSREGLFVPRGLVGSKRLLICEGPTDTAAALDLGYEAIGRPSCTGGARTVADLVRSVRPTDVVVVADADGPGRRGASVLVSHLVAVCSEVRVVEPPAGDLRDWISHGARRADLDRVIDAAAVRSLRWSIGVGGAA